jgi:putative ABC transport system permease protein
MTIVRVVIRAASWLVPSDSRDEWRREWLGEACAVAARGRSPIRFALGAPIHALALRWRDWRPASLVMDARFAARLLRRQPGFALAAVGTLALGTAATIGIFSVVYGVLLKPLPYREPDGLVQIWEKNPLFGWTEAEVAPGNVISWRERNVVFSGIAWYLAGPDRHGGLADLTLGGDQPERVRGLHVSPNFFDILGVSARIGRTFLPGEDTPGRHRVVVLSDGFWRRRFGALPEIVGATVPLNGRPWTVIGVMPSGFVFDDRLTDLWIPAAGVADAREARQPHILRAIARLAPGVTLSMAQENLSSIARDLEREHPETNRQMSVDIGPLDDWLVGRSRRPLLLFLAAVCLVLLIACANVANLLMARSAARGRELAVRAALGASRLRTMRQLLVESLVIAAAGTGIGLAIAATAVRLFVAYAPAALPRVNDIGLHPAISLFAIALTLVTTMLVGMVPAWQAGRTEPRAGVGEGGRSVSASGRLARLIVAVEVALAVVLLGSAAITLRSFRALVVADPGFEVNELTTAQIALPATPYSERAQVGAFYEELGARLRASPLVSAAGAAHGLPVKGSTWTGDLFIEGRPDVHARNLKHRSVTSGYLETLGLPLIAGRTIQTIDRLDQPLVVVINQTLARQFFADTNPVGTRIAFDPPSPKVRWRTIIGIVADEPQDGPGAPIAPLVYDSVSQEPMREMAVVVRSTAPSDQIVRLIRDAVRSMDPQLALAEPGPLTARIGEWLAPQQLAAALATVFAVIGLLLSLVGIYGVVAYAAATRTREVGIRVACGATRSDILRMLMVQHLRMASAGLGAGVLAAIVAADLAAWSLYGVPRHDVLGLAASSTVLFVSAVIACWLPARRALRIDPVAALRSG